MFSLAGLRPLPVAVKEARALLRGRRARGRGRAARRRPPCAPRRRRRFGASPGSGAALSLERVWVEFDDGTGAGHVALRGSTLSCAAARRSRCWGATAPARARCCGSRPGVMPARCAGACARPATSRCCSRRPSDYLLHERVRDELPRPWRGAALAELGPRAARRRRPARPVRRRAPAACARHRAGRAGHRRRRPACRGRARRADARDGPGAQGALAERLRAARARRARRCSSPRTTSSSRRALARRCVLLGRRTGGRRRPDGRGALGRALLHDRGRARARPRAARVLAEEGARSCADRRWRRERRAGPRGGGGAMSWQRRSARAGRVAALAGMLWYERRRPPAKLVALVAALAALAVAARVLFAAVPNVQATTDVALLAGYVLGPAPGVHGRRARGAGLELVPGPGAVDAVADAGLGRGRGRRRAAGAPSRAGALGRWALALACALAGFAFGAWMDLFTLITFAAESSADSYVAIAGVSLPFNIAHASATRPCAWCSGPRSCGCWSASAGGSTCAGRRAPRAAPACRGRGCGVAVPRPRDRAGGIRGARRGPGLGRRRPCATSSARRTATAASAAGPGSRPASS